MNSTEGNVLSYDIAFAALNFVSVCVCTLAAILVFVLKLHRKVVYRLSLYQVLASLAFAAVEVLQIISAQHNEIWEFDRACIAIGSLVVYTRWVKLLFTMWVTFHLFCFAVLHKNLKKLEVLYVVTSLLVPAVIAVVPLIITTYGLDLDGSNCYIYCNFNGTTSTYAAFIERFALWNAPATAILLAASIAMVAIVMKLSRTVRSRWKYEAITDSDQHWKAIKQLFPLVAFPMFFFVFIIPVLVFDIVSADNPVHNEALHLFVMIIIALWSMTSGVTLMVHISIAMCCTKKKAYHIPLPTAA